MDGLTPAQMRANTVTALRASSAVLALVGSDSARVMDGRLEPVEQSEAAFIVVTSGREVERTGGDQTFGLPLYQVESDVHVTLDAPEVGGEIDAVLDGEATIKAALLGSQTWMAQWTGGQPDMDTSRMVTFESDRVRGTAEIVFTCRHKRGY